MEATVSEMPPVWVGFLVSFILFLLASEAGFRIGLKRRADDNKLESGSTGVVTGSLLGLVSFLLAFSFGFAASNFTERRAVLIDEANAIGTAYLRADLMPDAQATEMRDLLRSYAVIRIEAAEQGIPSERMFELVRLSETLQGDIWRIAVALANDAPTPVHALVVAAVNDLIDTHTLRLGVGLRHTIPDIIWAALYAISALAIATTGYRFGASFGSRSELLPAMVFAFACVVSLIADLDSPRSGFLATDQSPMLDLVRTMEAGA